MFAPPGSSTVETHSADGMTYNPHPPQIKDKNSRSTPLFQWYTSQ